jgi:DNA polymerase III delta prime subunit
MISAQNGHDGQLGATDNDGEEEEDTKKRSKKQVANGQPTIFQGFRIKPEVTARSLEEAAAFTGPIPQVDLEVDPNYERRKRRKTVSPKTEQSTRNESHAHRAVTSDCDEGYVALEWHEQLKAEASKGTEEVEEQVPELDEPGSGQANGTSKQPIQYAERAASNSDQTTPTKSKDDELKTTRTMRLKGGKLASPIAQEQESLKTPRKSRRPKVVDPATLVVKVDYGRLSADAQKLGERIQGILNGKEVHRLPIFPKTKAAKANAKPEGPPKPTHPFFSGKVMKQEVNAKGNKAEETISARAQSPSVELTRPSPRKASTTTPGKLRAQRDAFLMPGSLSPKRGTAALSARKKLKSAGEHPSWPTRETAHVRALESLASSSPVDLRAFGYTLKSAKRKVDSNTVDQAESVLQVLASNINASEAVPRRPQRTVTTGPEIQSFVAKGLSTGIEDGQDTSSNKSVHPALKAMYRGIDGSLSAFDRFECETQTWALKYAPKSAAEVLQAGKEAFVLRDFLQRSIVSAVQTSSKRSTASSTISSNRGVQKKRKRKDEDDFIVESDAELDEQDELLPLSDSSRERRYQWSLARGGDEYLRSTPGSTVLLSGPSGCGKTAAVYAVARELGFEVFEINSASRRSGKDVLDKIGDMAENHLVQQVSKALTEDRPTTNDTRLEAIKIEQPDVPDPKQKSMGSFFKAAPAAKKSAPSSKQLLQKSVAQAKGNNTKPKSQQKQSLILLEEVDVLFEEDKQFWMTILTLAAHSKRPIIMTCNDEKYVPIEALTFHAILRFVPPPADLAIDYLLLLAAREGHLLERQSVESLYRIKAHDVRGSITELDLWCQIAVGDPTRGFNWMLDRYPPGTDVDAHGRTLRVTSERTYVKGMNVVCHDLQQSERESITLQQSLWSQAWEDWQVNAMDGFENLGEFDSSIGLLKPEQNGSNALDRFVFMADVLSAGDVCFGFCMREPKQVCVGLHVLSIACLTSLATPRSHDTSS